MTAAQIDQPIPVGSPDLMAAFVSCRPALVETAARVVGCRRLAEDVVQETFIKIHEMPYKEGILQPAGYLVRMVRNLAIDFYRRLSLELQHMRPEEDGLQVCAPCASPEAAAVHREGLCVLARALAELPERTRAAFEMHRLEGCTQKEIAAHFGVSTTLVNFMVRDAHNHCMTVWTKYQNGQCPGQRAAAA
jgi:RNA polymerase sigma factor (sigma-70 family)